MHAGIDDRRSLLREGSGDESSDGSDDDSSDGDDDSQVGAHVSAWVET